MPDSTPTPLDTGTDLEFDLNAEPKASSISDLVDKAIKDRMQNHVIICRIRNFYPPENPDFRYGNGIGRITLHFLPAQCEGGLPDSRYVGAFAKQEVCGADESWEVIQPYDSQPVGVTFWYLGACGHPMSPSNIEVVFTRRL